MQRTLNTRQLEAFRAVMLSGSITRAGGLMSISQPAVTRLIKDLEADLRMSLFVRHGPSLIPTPEAKSFYAEVERFFISTDRLRSAAHQIRSHGPARLRISAFPAIATTILPEAIFAFLQDEPETLISISTGASVDIVDDVVSGKADMIILARPTNRHDLDFLPFPRSRAVCILPASHHLNHLPAVTPMDMDAQDYVALGQNSLMRYELQSLLEEGGAQPNLRIESLFSSSVVRYVECGIGIGVVDPLVAADCNRDKISIKRFDPEISYQPSVVFAESAAKSEKLRQLMDHIISAYKDKIAELDFYMSKR